MGDGHFYGEQFGNQYNEPIYGYQGSGYFGGYVPRYGDADLVHHFPSYNFDYGVHLDDPFYGPADFSRSEDTAGGVTNSQYHVNQPHSFQHVSFSVPQLPFYG